MAPRRVTLKGGTARGTQQGLAPGNQTPERALRSLQKALAAPKPGIFYPVMAAPAQKIALQFTFEGQPLDWGRQLLTFMPIEIDAFRFFQNPSMSR